MSVATPAVAVANPEKLKLESSTPFSLTSFTMLLYIETGLKH